MPSWLQLFRPANPTTQTILAGLSSFSDHDPSLQQLKQLAIINLSLVVSAQTKQPRMHLASPTFETASGSSPHYPFPAFDYIRLLSIAVWEQAIRHACLLHWPSYLGDLGPEPSLSLEETVEWCKNTCILIETLLRHCREWVPDDGPLSLLQNRHRQAALLAMVQALAVLDPRAEKNTATLRALEQAHLILASNKDPLPHIAAVSEYLRHAWCHELALLGFDNREFPIAYWALCQLDLLNRRQFYDHRLNEIMQDLDIMKTEGRLSVFVPTSSDLMHIHYREKYLLPAPAIPPDRPVPLLLFDTQQKIGVYEVCKLEL